MHEEQRIHVSKLSSSGHGVPRPMHADSATGIARCFPLWQAHRLPAVVLHAAVACTRWCSLVHAIFVTPPSATDWPPG